MNQTPNDLPFRPWWWKPKYTGRHRGEYPKKFIPTPGGTIPAMIPYGLRELKVRPYDWGAGPSDASGSILLPNMQTIGFTSGEDYPNFHYDEPFIATYHQRGVSPVMGY